MNSKDIIKLAEQNGWVLVRTRGSHHQFKKAGVPMLLTIPHPKKDLPIGTLRQIEKIIFMQPQPPKKEQS